MYNNILSAPVASFQIHDLVRKTCRDKNLDSLIHTMKKYGQISKVKVVKKEEQLHIIDGVSVFDCAKEIGLHSLQYEEMDIKEEEIMLYRMLSNQRTKRTFTEICLNAEYVLDTIGKSQGRKRDLLGFDDFDNDDFYGKVGKDRFGLACALMGIDMKGSTLRQLMYVFYSEYNPNGKSKLGILEKLDAGEISINRAYKLLKEAERKKKEYEDTKKAKLFIAHSNLNGEDKPYKLYCKSSLILEDLQNNSIDLCIESPVYALDQRKYRNQDELQFGQEKTREEYLDNFDQFTKERFRVLKKGGVYAVIMGESYKNGYQGICTRAELILEKNGFKILDVIIWAKSNQQYAAHQYRFQNTYERIIVAYKPGAEPYFQDVYRKSSAGDFKIKPTSNGKFYISKPETCITNLIITPTHDPKVFKEIDPEFKHDAPAPASIFEVITEAYSRPGFTILDGFIGSGTAGVALKMGRKVIGYDIDPLNIEFSKKRFEKFISEANESNADELASASKMAA